MDKQGDMVGDASGIPVPSESIDQVDNAIPISASDYGQQRVVVVVVVVIRTVVIRAVVVLLSVVVVVVVVV